jgi:acyl carrier protein
MQSKEYIYEQLLLMMQELFEIDAADVKPESLLDEDLDIDSIDAVDMAARLHEITGHKLKPESFKQIHTVQDLVDAGHSMLNADGARIAEEA